MLDALKRTVLTTKDLAEQPASDYVLIVAQGSAKAYYAVDNWEQVDDNMVFSRGDVPIVGCRQDGQWTVLHRSLVEPITNEDLMRGSLADHEAVEKLHTELHPDEKDEKVVDRATHPTGQYI